MPDFCYLCGATPATKPKATILKDSFTQHSRAKFPTSNYLCGRCTWVLPLRLNYYNSNSGKEVKLFARCWSWLLSAGESHPTIEDDWVKDLPNRATIRRWLLEPPEPPFTIAIAESGQKHILPFSQEAHNRDFFPVLFEHDLFFINRQNFAERLAQYEFLLGLGVTKTEINSGQYKGQNLFKLSANTEFWAIDESLAEIRKTRFFELVGYVAISQLADEDLAVDNLASVGV